MGLGASQASRHADTKGQQQNRAWLRYPDAASRTIETNRTADGRARVAATSGRRQVVQFATTLAMTVLLPPLPPSIVVVAVG